MDECDVKTPGGVYLCQVDESISCGACCGLYNVADPSFENISSILQKRTELFEQTPGDYDSLERFREQVEKSENQQRPYPEFHHCPYLGFVGANASRPGCLLHPLNKKNASVDRRGLSHWGGFACATYFCPTCSAVAPRFKQILKMCCENWYIFGLIVTETELISTYFSLIEKELASELDPIGLSANPAFISAVKRFFNLKISWPFRPMGFNRLANYFFNDNLYPRTPINYTGLGSEHSDKDPVFRALGSEFVSRNDLELAEQRIFEAIQEACDAVRSNPQQGRDTP